MHLLSSAMTSQWFCDNLEVAHALLCMGKSLAYFCCFLLVRYHGDNSTITGAVMGTVVIGFMCHLILEIRMRLTDSSSRGAGASASGAYILLEQPQWLPDVDPKKVNKNAKQLSLRIPQVKGDNS